MKTLHQIDMPAQIAILAASFLAMIIEPSYLFFGFYFGIGGWQLLMSLCFAFDDDIYTSSARKNYSKMLLWVIGIGILCAIIYPIFMFYLLALLPVGLGMAIWNFTIAMEEFKLAQSNHEVWDVE